MPPSGARKGLSGGGKTVRSALSGGLQAVRVRRRTVGRKVLVLMLTIRGIVTNPRG